MDRPQYGEIANPSESSGICYKHKGLFSFILCNRCARTICDKCVNRIEIGVVCADCLKLLRPKRSITKQIGFGVRKHNSFPVVTITLIIISVFVWVAQYFVGKSVTMSLWYAPIYAMPEYFEPWRMLTVMFTHSPSSIMHILSNMWTLWIFGPALESALGKVKFTLLYVLAGWGGSVFVTLWAYIDESSLTIPTVGASGAIFGLMGAILMLYKHLSLNIRSLVILVTINLIVGFMPGSAVSWQAHIGGFVIGVFLIWLLTRPKIAGKKSLEIIAFGAVILLLACLSCSLIVS